MPVGTPVSKASCTAHSLLGLDTHVAELQAGVVCPQDDEAAVDELVGGGRVEVLHDVAAVLPDGELAVVERQLQVVPLSLGVINDAAGFDAFDERSVGVADADDGQFGVVGAAADRRLRFRSRPLQLGRANPMPERHRAGDPEKR